MVIKIILSALSTASSNSGAALNHDLDESGSPANCIYPKTPNNVTSFNSNIGSPVSGQAYAYVAINITCPDGYGLDGDSFFSCYNGMWSPSANLSKCVKPSCYLPASPTVEYNCIVPDVNGLRPCEEYETSGTVVKPQCRRPNYYSATDLHFMRCLNGRWDYIASCDPECGILTPEGTQLMIGGESAKRGEVPWHAGIYTKTRKPFEQICGGSLISKNIILSAAHCFWSGSEGRKVPADKFAVAVGKLYRPWDESHDDAQQSDVKEIHIKPHFKGLSNYNIVDIAVVVVTKPFEYKNHIRPVCLDFSRIFQYRQLQPGAKGKVAGWGLTSENGHSSQVLKVIELPYVEISKCIDEAPALFQNYISPDKMCAGYKNEHKGLCMGDSGGGLSFPIQEKTTTRYYLRGIASTSSNERNVKCDVDFYTTFTQILDHEDFIKQFWVADHAATYNPLIPEEDDLNIDKRLFQHLRFWIQKGNCVLPDYPSHGTYFTHIPNAEPGEAYEFVAIHVSCDEGYEVDSIDGSRDVYCFNGTWIPRPIPKCISADIEKPRKGSCMLPPYPDHGTYVANFADARPGDAFDYVYINITCRQGYGMESIDRHREAFCYEGKWLPEDIPKCTRLCRLPQHPSVQYRCYVSGSEDSTGERDCKEFEPSGTIIIPRCNIPHYYSATVLPYMRCVGGSWDYVAVCSPECGIISPLLNPDGSEDSNSDSIRRPVPIPWHATVYSKYFTPYKVTCGGSVISHNTVLSAAHCYWNIDEHKIQPTNIYSVAVGKQYVFWEDTRDDSQISDVKSIHIPKRFNDAGAHYESDIAILVVVTSFRFGLNVQPVCVDFYTNFEQRQLQPGNVGKVAAWGIKVEQSLHDYVFAKLNHINMIYSGIETCITHSSLSFRDYITSDKICAAYQKVNTSHQLCKGDSGTGLVFPNVYKGRLRYYLRGIASTSPLDNSECMQNDFIYFTSLMRHEHFIKEYWIGLEEPVKYSTANIDTTTVMANNTGPRPDLTGNYSATGNIGFTAKPAPSLSCLSFMIYVCKIFYLYKI